MTVRMPGSIGVWEVYIGGVHGPSRTAEKRDKGSHMVHYNISSCDDRVTEGKQRSRLMT